MAVYDCFTFFNEFELLDIRLQILNEYVDFFVIAESNKTFKNRDKEFNLEKILKNENKDYYNKIIYIKVDDMPNYTGKKEDCWVFEYYQRNALQRGLVNCELDDLIMLSDIDEIPNPVIFKAIKENQLSINFFPERKKYKHKIKRVLEMPLCLLKKQWGEELLDKIPLALEQKMFYYFLNCKNRGVWPGTIFVKYKNINTLQNLRDERYRLPRVTNDNIGWHFSYLGGAERIILKAKSIVDSPMEDFTKAYVKECIKSHMDLYGRKGDEFTYDIIDKYDIGLYNIDAIVSEYPHLYYENK